MASLCCHHCMDSPAQFSSSSGLLIPARSVNALLLSHQSGRLRVCLAFAVSVAWILLLNLLLLLTLSYLPGQSTLFFLLASFCCHHCMGLAAQHCFFWPFYTWQVSPSSSSSPTCCNDWQQSCWNYNMTIIILSNHMQNLPESLSGHSL